METQLGNLAVRLLRNDGTPKLILSGNIDELSKLDAIVADFGDRSRACIDIGGVEYINSLGVREWIRMLQVLEAAGVSTTLFRCPEVMIQQMNMMPEVMIGCDVDSFLAPYECYECGSEIAVLLRITDHLDALLDAEPPIAKCSECGREMGFADMAERYFHFLHRLPIASRGTRACANKESVSRLVVEAPAARAGAGEQTSEPSK